MRCRTKLLVLCALSIVGEPSLAVDESVSSLSSPSPSQSPAATAVVASFTGYSSLGDTKAQFPGDKRVSAYRSEFKRLPLFTFGLGKRFAPSFDGASKVQRRDFEFGMSHESPLTFSMGQDKRLISRLMTTGLGKRSVPRYTGTGLEKKSVLRLKTTGLGKRLPSSYAIGLGKRDEWKDMGFGLGKRLSFNDKAFGLGKRATGIQFGLGRRSSSGMFGLGKRSSSSSSRMFGLGKRSPSGRMFGLGKRPSTSKMFGLGKRDYYDYGDDDGDDDADDVDGCNEVIDYDQVLDAHSPDKRKFDLGLGKRVMELYEDLPEEEKRGNSMNFGMGKRYIVDDDDEEDDKQFE